MGNIEEINFKITINEKEATASLKLTNDDVKNLYNSFKYGKQEVSGFTTAISQSFNNAREIFQGVKETYSALKMAYGSMIEAYGEAELSETKLKTALKQTGNFTNQNFEELKKYAGMLQTTTLYEDDAYIGIMGLLQAMGLTVEQTKLASLQTANLATLMGTDLSGAARVMGDLFAGDATMIKRYIKGLDETIIKSGDTAKIIEYLNTRIGGQAEEAAKTGAGAIAQMNNALGDVQENAGMLASKAFNPLITGVRDFVGWLNISHPVIGGAILAVGTLTATLIALQVTGITGATKALMIGLIPAVKSLFETVMLWSMYNPFTAALLAITAVAAGIATIVATQKTELETLQETVDLHIEDNRLQKEKINNNIAQINSENGLISKANELYNSSSKLKNGTEERNKKETELKTVLNDLMRLNPNLINSNNTLAVNMQLLNEKRQSNITKEQEYQTELENTIKKLDQLNAKKFWVDYTTKVEDSTGSTGETFWGQDTALTQKFKDAAYTGTIEDRIKNLESLKNITNKELVNLGDFPVNRIEERANEFRTSVNDLLETLYNQKKYMIESVQSATTKDDPKKDKNDDVFNKQKQIISAAETHALEMARIQGSSDEKLSNMKVTYIDKMIDLYKKYKKDTTELLYQKQEIEAKLDNRPAALPANSTPAKANIGDVGEYKRYSGTEEIENWRQQEYKKVEIYANADEMKGAIDEEATKRFGDLKEVEKKIEEDAQQAKISAAMSALSFISGGVAKHTFLGKMAGAAMATINTYEAATKALTLGIPLGPIFAGIITAMGLVNVGKILATQTPGYAMGGRLPQGQTGFVEGYYNEIIAPEKTFVDIMRSELIPRVIGGTPVISANVMFEKALEKINNWQKEMTFRIERGDLYASWEQEKNFRTRHAT